MLTDAQKLDFGTLAKAPELLAQPPAAPTMP